MSIFTAAYIYRILFHAKVDGRIHNTVQVKEKLILVKFMDTWYLRDISFIRKPFVQLVVEWSEWVS